MHVKRCQKIYNCQEMRKDARNQNCHKMQNRNCQEMHAKIQEIKIAIRCQKSKVPKDARNLNCQKMRNKLPRDAEIQEIKIAISQKMPRNQSCQKMPEIKAATRCEINCQEMPRFQIQKILPRDAKRCQI